MKTFKNKLTSVCCALLMLGSAFALSSCATVLGTGIVSGNGTAYDIAKKHGFTGTEAEWLSSLKGTSGKDGADGEDLDINDLYAAADKTKYPTLDDFIQSIVNVYLYQNDTRTIADNMMSTVSIICGFTTTEGRERTLSSSAGTGVVLSVNKEEGDAYIVTNYHVVYDHSSDSGISQNIYVYPYGSVNRYDKNTITDSSEDAIEATFIGGAMDYDIALLKVDSEDYIKTSALTAAKLGDSEHLEVGENVFAIGNALGKGLSVSNGVISVLSQHINLEALDNENQLSPDIMTVRVLRTTAAINSGNSGGGLFNANGELIGIVNAKNIQTTTDNVGFALPITQVKYLLKNIWDNGGSIGLGCVQRATLGINSTIYKSVAENTDKLQIKETIMISKVFGSTAAYNKLFVGDIIEYIIIGGVKYPITRNYQIGELLLQVRLGDSVKIGVLRGDNNGSQMVQKEVEIRFNSLAHFTKYA